MVMQTALHMGKIIGLGKKTVKFKKRTAGQRTWNQGKLYFREAIEDIEDENIALGAEPELQANAAMMGTAGAKQKACNNIASKVSSSFGALVSAAVTKADTIDSHALTITTLTKAIAELTETNKQLVAQLAVLLMTPRTTYI